MEVRQRYAIRLPNELYDEALDFTKSHEAVREFVEHATRFWLSIRAAPLERHILRAEHELFITIFLRFLTRIWIALPPSPISSKAGESSSSESDCLR